MINARPIDLGPVAAPDHARGEGLIARVRTLIAERLRPLGDLHGSEEVERLLRSGKMLRTRLACCLVSAGLPEGPSEHVAPLCAAVEMTHTASLCHDDVIDDARLRRGVPTLWRLVGRPAAILLGDHLLCSALDLARSSAATRRYEARFLATLREVLEAEIEQELRLRGRPADEETCLRIARAKTGPFFGFVAHACGGSDETLARALEEAGYRIGAAYQLSDDLLDLLPVESAAGKSLGTDATRGKPTLASGGPDRARAVRAHVASLCDGAVGALATWPRAAQAVRQYLEHHLASSLPAPAADAVVRSRALADQRGLPPGAGSGGGPDRGSVSGRRHPGRGPVDSRRRAE